MLNLKNFYQKTDCRNLDVKSPSVATLNGVKDKALFQPKEGGLPSFKMYDSYVEDFVDNLGVVVCTYQSAGAGVVTQIANSAMTVNGYAQSMRLLDDPDNTERIPIASGYTFNDNGIHAIEWLLPNNQDSKIKILHNNAFNGVSSIIKVEFKGVTNVNQYAFQDCANLEEVIFDDALKFINTRVFLNSGVKRINSSVDGVFNLKKAEVVNGDFLNANQNVKTVTATNWSGVTSGGYHFSGSTIELFDGKSLNGTTDSMFTYCRNLKEVHIGNVINVRPSAFYECNNLTCVNANGKWNVYLPEATSVYSSFYNCQLLKNIYLPKVTSIGPSSFRYLNQLKEIILGDVTGAIGSYSFESCSALTRVNSDIDGVFNFPEATEIGYMTFPGCRNVKVFNAPKVTKLNSYNFQHCEILEEVIFGNATAFGNGEFRENGNLKYINRNNNYDIYLPNLTEMGPECFLSCSSITGNVQIENVKALGNRVFQNCSGITSIYAPSVETIDTYTFEHCEKMESFNFNSLKSTGFACFRNCNSITEATLPSLENVGDQTFAYMSSVTKIHIPKATSLGTMVFYGSPKLYEIDFGNTLTAVPELKTTQQFSNNLATRRIIVPDSLYNEWKTATNWSDFASMIVKYSEYYG